MGKPGKYYVLFFSFEWGGRGSLPRGLRCLFQAKFGGQIEKGRRPNMGALPLGSKRSKLELLLKPHVSETSTQRGERHSDPNRSGNPELVDWWLGDLNWFL